MSLSEKLIFAAKNGNTKEVRKLLSRGALFTKDQFGNTALHEAAWNGNSDIVKILLNGFCFVDSINNTGFTPLHLASQNGHAKIVKTLLKWKADPALLNQHGETALHLVAKYDHANVVPAFASFKVSLDLRGKDGNTALHIASKLGNIDSVKAMLSSGAHPAIPNEKGLRPMDYAEYGGYNPVAKLLNTAIQKMKPRKQRSMTPVGSSSKSFTSSPFYSLSQPEEHCYGLSLSQPAVDLPAVRPRMQRAMSVSSKVHYRPSKDVWASVNKNKNRKNHSELRDHGTKVSGSLSPSPHKYFSSQDDLDSGAYTVRTEQSSRSTSPGDQPATIDQLLSAIERETHGPGYRYVPPQEDPYSDISMYSESPRTGGHPLSIGSNGFETPQTPKSCLKSTGQGKENYDILVGQDPKEVYDYLPPQNLNSNANNSPSQNMHASNHVQVHIDHAQKQVQAAQQILEGGVSPELTKVAPTPRSPSKRGKFKNHTYETLLPKESDGDTYVYMAPLSDYPELLQKEQQAIEAMKSNSPQPQPTDEQSSPDDSSCSELSFSGANGDSKGGKKAAISDSPVEPDAVHEPNLILEPMKGILLQCTSSEAEKSQLESYLQNELETIRQTFQIRFNQLEKRYQRQLGLEKQKNTASPLMSQRLDLLRRRNSWHSCSSADQDLDRFADVEKRSGSALGCGDSDVSGVESELSVVKTDGDISHTHTGPDVYEHDPSLVNELPESPRDTSQSIHSTPVKTTECLKGGTKNWSDEKGQVNSEPSSDKDAYDFDYEDMSGGTGHSVHKDSHLLVQQKVKDYRERMLKHFREKSEAQIAAIEREYQSQINEVQRKCQYNATEKVVRLQSRIKDLENRLEVQTLV